MIQRPKMGYPISKIMCDRNVLNIVCHKYLNLLRVSDVSYYYNDARPLSLSHPSSCLMKTSNFPGRDENHCRAHIDCHQAMLPRIGPSVSVHYGQSVDNGALISFYILIIAHTTLEVSWPSVQCLDLITLLGP